MYKKEIIDSIERYLAALRASDDYQYTLTVDNCGAAHAIEGKVDALELLLEHIESEDRKAFEMVLLDPADFHADEYRKLIADLKTIDEDKDQERSNG